MSIQLPPPGQISADGMWSWDGAKWVPRNTAAPAQPVAVTAYVVTRPTNGTAVASLVIGILSWFMCPVLGGLLAVIFGHTARGQIRRTGEGGGGMALAGLILGYASLVVDFGFVFIWILLLGGMTAFLGILGTLPAVSPSP